MSIEKLSCCLAKPMNAIRDLVSKVNEIIKAHNDHLENHPSGGGGGGSEGAGNAGIMNVTVLTEEECESPFGELYQRAWAVTFDKSFDEILEAALNHYIVTCWRHHPDMTFTYHIQQAYSEMIVFESYVVGIEQIALVMPDGSGFICTND